MRSSSGSEESVGAAETLSDLDISDSQRLTRRNTNLGGHLPRAGTEIIESNQLSSTPR